MPGGSTEGSGAPLLQPSIMYIHLKNCSAVRAPALPATISHIRFSRPLSSPDSMNTGKHSEPCMRTATSWYLYELHNLFLRWQELLQLAWDASKAPHTYCRNCFESKERCLAQPVNAQRTFVKKLLTALQYSLQYSLQVAELAELPIKACVTCRYTS